MENNEDYLRDSFYEDEDQKESEDDIGALADEAIRQAVVTATDWTTETIINQIGKGNIQLNPRFQRRDAWTKERKSKYIESLFLGLPVPQIVLAQSKDTRGKYIVLDGKQRLLSMTQFAAAQDDEQQLKLSGLEIRKELNGKSLADLKGELQLYDDLSAFENQPIRTVVIKNWPNENYLYLVFLRLNTESVKLSPQELRQALHPGPFVSFIDETSQTSGALRDILGNPKPDFRMRDAELLVRYYAFARFLQRYRGNLKEFLDDTCKQLNGQWATQENAIRSDFAEFEEAHWAVREVFDKDAYHKWTGDAFESRFNRAIFDVLIYVFRKPAVRRRLIESKDTVVDIFKRLCESNPDFLSSVEQTTKSVWATHTRLSLWCEQINTSFGVDVRVPAFS